MVTRLLVLLALGCDGGDEHGHDGDGGDTDASPPEETDSPVEPPPPDADQDGAADDVDCDDGDPEVYPGAPDLCGDGRVTDCDRSSDDGLVNLDGTRGFDDLAEALAAASDGSELVLCPGIYTGRFVATVPVRIVALEDAITTTLEGDGDSVLVVAGGTEVVGLTIRGGSGASGGGVRMTSAGALDLLGLVVTRNEAGVGGGIALAPGAVATLTDTRVVGNDANGAGGVHVPEGAVLDLSAGSEVSDNTAAMHGGGIWVDGGEVIGGTVSGNRQLEYSYAYYYYGLPDLTGEAFGGGGIATSGVASITGTVVSGNRAPYGGGVSATGGALTLTDVSVRDNDAFQLGGGLMVTGAAVTLDGTSEIADNVGGEAAGGMLVAFGSVSGGTVSGNRGGERAGGALVVQGSISDQRIEGNRSNGGQGGGVFAIGLVDLARVTVEGNSGERGGGVATDEEYGNFFYDYTPTLLTITDSVISGNDARWGGGVHSGWGAVLVDTEVSGNTADHGAGLFVQADATSVTGGAVLANLATANGGGATVSSGTLSVSEVDFGADASDNGPVDVRSGGLDYAEYAAGATFTCDAAGCAP